VYQCDLDLAMDSQIVTTAAVDGNEATRLCSRARVARVAKATTTTTALPRRDRARRVPCGSRAAAVRWWRALDRAVARFSDGACVLLRQGFRV
jgi:hypothetical protein